MFRKILNLILFTAFFVAPAPASVSAAGVLLLAGFGPAATLDLTMNPGTGVCFLGATATDCTSILSITRASVDEVQWADGHFTQVGANALALSDLGLQIEESRTNGILASNMQNGVAGTCNGSTGTYPFSTNFGMLDLATILSSGGLEGQITQVGTDQGINEITVCYVGTSGASGNGQFSGIVFLGAGGQAMTQGQTFAFSAFIHLTAGSLTNISAIQLCIDEHASDAPKTYLATDCSSDLKALVSNASLGLNRLSTALTMTNASCATGATYVKITEAANSSINATFEYGFPQAELGAFTTSPIVTANNAVTRNNDNISFANKSLIPNSAGTIFDEFETGYGFNPSSGTLVAAYDNAFANGILLLDTAAVLDTSNFSSGVFAGGSLSNHLSPNTVYRGTDAWGGTTYDLTGSAAAGTSPQTQTGVVAPAVAFQNAFVGWDGNTAHYANGWLRTLLIFNSHVSPSLQKAWAQTLN